MSVALAAQDGVSVQQPVQPKGPTVKIQKTGGGTYTGVKVQGGYRVGGFGGRDPYFVPDSQVARILSSSR